MLTLVQWTAAVLMLLHAIHAVATGRMHVKGAGVYLQAERPGGFWFMVVSHVVAGALFAGMAWYRIPP